MSSDDWLSMSLTSFNNSHNNNNNNSNNNNEATTTTTNTTIYDATVSNGTAGTLYSSNSTLIIDTSSTSPISAQFLSWCCFVLFCFVVRPNIPDASHRIAERARQREERLTELRKNPQVRQRAMEQGLITKVSQ